MKKFIDFIKKVGNVLYDLFLASNRWMHLIVGGIIYIIMMASIAIWTPHDPIPFQCCFGATIAVFITMCSVEYKDKAKGGMFDWRDILAGVSPALLIDIICIFLLLFK